MLEQNWNQNWTFWERRDSFALTAGAPADAQQVILPHDAMLHKPPRADSPNGGDTGYRDGGVYIYEKSFTPEPGSEGQTWLLKLEGVYRNAMVYVNGALAARQPYGYTAIYVPLHRHMRPGRNTVRVEARNSAQGNARWYTGSGIYRDAYLLRAGAAFLAPESLLVDTRSLPDPDARLRVRAKVVNRGLTGRRFTLALTVEAAHGSPEVRLTRTLPVGPGEEEWLRTDLLLPQAALWSAESPALYTLRARLLEGEQVVDESVTTFGVRTVAPVPGKGLLVNGVPVTLRGACVHHDNGLLGAAAYDEAEYRRVRLLKQAGFNAIRMSHQPMSQAMLRACDRLGMYVLDELYDMWTRCKGDNDHALYFDRWWREDLEAMIRKDYNCPCVLGYSLGNEIPELGADDGIRWLRRLNEAAKTLDDTRFTTVAINGVFAVSDQIGQIVEDIFAKLPPEERASCGDGGNVNTFMNIMDRYMDQIVTHPLVSRMVDDASAAVDVVGYNYMTGRYLMDKADHPDRVILGTETYPPQISRNWKAMAQCPNVAGDFTWTGWDYIGEAGVGIPAYRFGEGGFGALFPCQLSYVGDLDILGFRRPASYYREVVFGLRTRPYIAVWDPARYGQTPSKTNWVLSDSISSWTWPGFEGKPIVVEVYASSPQVELRCNGVRVGVQPCGSERDYIARFTMTYRPGVLTAVSDAGEMSLTTAGTPTVHVREEPMPPESRLHYYAITLEDEFGVVHTAQDQLLSIQVGNGALLGFGSADPKPELPYDGTLARTWHGRALAIVRSDGAHTVHVKAAKNI